MKVIVVIFVTILLLHYVTSMKGGNQKNNNNKGNGNKGQKVTLFPCHNRVLRAERIVGGPPGKQKNWNGFVNVKKAKKPLTVTMIFDFPTKVTVVCIASLLHINNMIKRIFFTKLVL